MMGALRHLLQRALSAREALLFSVAALFAAFGGVLAVVIYWSVAARMLGDVSPLQKVIASGVLLIGCLTVLRAASRYLERLIGHGATLHLSSRLRLMLFERLASRAKDALNEAEITERLIGDLSALDGLVLRILLPLTGGIAGMLALMAVWSLAGPFAVAGAIALTVVLLLLNRLAAPTAAEEAALAANGVAGRKAALRLMEAASELRIAGQVDAAMRMFDTTDREREDMLGRRLNRAFVADLANAVLPFLLFAAVFFAGGETQPALLAAFASLLAAEVVLTVLFAGRLWPLTMRALARVDALAGSGGDKAASNWRDASGGIIARAITLQHGEVPVLKDLDLEVRPAELVAIMGRSGAGKSSLLKVLDGELIPQSGSVTAMQRVILVDQRLEIISASLRDNLRLARPDASDAGMTQVLEDLALLDAVADRGGLDLWVGENGAALSGGQARRVMLARALLVEDALLLLDEPTEGLDEETASMVMRQLRARLSDHGGRAAVIVTHDPKVAAFCDRILRLEAGTLTG